MKALTGILVVALAACSTPSEIVKTGPNAYRVRTDAGGGSPRLAAELGASAESSSPCV